jgi:hypothetical protein
MTQVSALVILWKLLWGQEPAEWKLKRPS